MPSALSSSTTRRQSAWLKPPFRKSSEFSFTDTGKRRADLRAHRAHALDQQPRAVLDRCRPSGPRGGW
jgi:hypothetical protein